MKKILQVYPKLNIGGTEKVIENIIKILNEKYEFWILTEEKGEMEENFVSIKAKIKQIKRGKNYWDEVSKFLKKEQFDCIHVHNYKDMGKMLKIAKKNNIKIRIAHSHVGRKENICLNFLKRIKSYPIEKYANHYVACSYDAAKWLFQRNYKKAILLKNGIDRKKFQYQKEKGFEIRKKYNIKENDFVIGIIARLSKEKNHQFLIEVFKNISKNNPSLKMMFVGDGPLRKELEEKCKQENIEKKVIFTGSVTNTEDFYSSFDIFVLPSLFEGLPVSLIEAQYNDIPCLISKNISKEVELEENNLQQLPLEEKIWCKKIEEIRKEPKIRKVVTSKKFDIEENIKVLEKIYETKEKLVVFTNTVSNELNAGPKAPRDILKILKNHYNISYKLYYCPTNKWEKIREQIRKCYLFYYAYLKNKHLTVVQYPLIKYKKLTEKLGKNGILWIHDLNSIRYEKEEEIDSIKNYKYIIAHNQKMKEYLIQNNVKKEKIYTLDCFDYLCEEEKIKEKKWNKNDITIAFAGNLIKEKTPFLYELKKEKMNYTLNVYGVGIENDIHEKIKYQGSFLPEELPNKLDADFGLVWDGKCDESDENEGFKKYTKYNNPHKLSCYLAAGLPVIVWKKSAIKDFVLKNNLGYAVNSLEEINKLDFKDYEQIKSNVEEFKQKVRSGYFTKKMIDKILEENRKK